MTATPAVVTVAATTVDRSRRTGFARSAANRARNVATAPSIAVKRVTTGTGRMATAATPCARRRARLSTARPPVYLVSFAATVRLTHMKPATTETRQQATV